MLGNISESKKQSIQFLCEEFKKNNQIDPSNNAKYTVKRGLRNDDGTGVVAGLTLICNVHGYYMDESELVPIDGELIYRGVNVKDLVKGCAAEKRFGFEETIWLLLFGYLPNKSQLDMFTKILADNRELPDGFTEDMIMKAPSNNVMNKLARSVLALYSYDDFADDLTLQNVMRQSIQLIAMSPSIMINAYQVKRHHYDKKTMFFHPTIPEHSIAESILSRVRIDRKFTPEEARLLDLCLILHAEHGGGNNSTFACRVLSSSGTDTYASISAAIGSLKGPKHGGANGKVMEMLSFMKKDISDWTNEEQVTDYLKRIINKEAGDRSGLIYGIGHAVYTKSDPRAIILRENAMKLAIGTKYESEFKLLEMVERLAPLVFADVTGKAKVISANVDLYSGLVYKMLGLPSDIFTPLFAVSRMAGWCAHRIEEIMNGNRIIRPAYKALAIPQEYIPLEDRL